MKKIAKFERYQTVIVSGTFTGKDDFKGVVYEVDFNEIEKCFYYLVSFSGVRFYCNEKFISHERN